LIATSVEIVLFAVSWDPVTDVLRLISTSYTVPNNNITVIKIIGSQSGRIFMIGNDNNTYEIDYACIESAWSSIFGIENDKQIHKCQKINHTKSYLKLNNLFPFFQIILKDKSDNLIDILIDDMRNVLYTVSLKGVLSVFFLGLHNKDANLHLIKEFHLSEEINLFFIQNPQSNNSIADILRYSVY
jgi:hypothetical protein